MEIGRVSNASLLSRRASSRFASTSQPARAVYYSAYGDDAPRQPQPKVIALPWTERQDEGWDTRQRDRSFQTELLPMAGARVETSAVTAEAKPLKINRDLLLYRAKLARTNSFMMPTVAERLACYQQAEEALRKCIELDPVDARAYVALGKLLVLQRRFEEGRKVYEDGIAVTGGQNEFLWQSWATLEAKAGKSAQARKLYKAAVLVNPQHAASWHAWGMLEKREGNLTAARDLWVKGVKKTNGKPNPHLYGSLAILAGEMGFVDEARAWFKQGTTTTRGANSNALWHAWAQLEERSGEPRVVRYLYKRGLEAYRRSRYTHLAWAMFEKLQGEVENARKLLERGQKLNPKDPAILQAWGVLEAEEGDLEAARKLFRRSTEADPQHIHAWQAWAMLELRDGNLDRARELFQSAVWCPALQKDICTVWHGWAVLEFTAENYHLARSLCSCAVKADPSSAKAWETWMYQEEQQGNDSQVLVLQKARDLRQGDVKLQGASQLALEAAAEVGRQRVTKNVMQTVTEWSRKFESKQRPPQRRPPSYLLPPDESSEPALLEERTEELPSLSEMIDQDSPDLALPVISSFASRQKTLKQAKEKSLGHE